MACTPHEARPRKTTAKDACGPWGEGGGNEAGANAHRSISSDRHGKPGPIKAVVAALLRPTVSKEEFYVFSGTKQVFPSTYNVLVWWEPQG